MDIALKKLELVRRLLSIWDEARLERVAKVIEQEVPQLEDGITEEEIAELDAEHDKALRNEGPSYTWEQVKEMARNAVRG